MASQFFGIAIKKLNDGTMDWDTLGSVRAVLVKSSYNSTINADTHDFLNDVPSGDRASATFKLITTRAVNISATANKQFFDGVATLTYPTVTNGTKCGGIVIFKSSAASTTSCALFCYCQFSANVTADGGTVTVNKPTNGYFQASY